MSLVDLLPGASEMEGLLSHRPQLLTKYRTFYESFWQDGLVPRRVLALVRVRVAHIHGCDAELKLTDPEAPLSEAEYAALSRGDAGIFNAAEQCALALAELIPHSVHMISDAQVQEASAHFGHPGCVSLLTALAFFDVNCRLKLVFEIPPTTAEIRSGVVA